MKTGSKELTIFFLLTLTTKIALTQDYKRTRIINKLINTTYFLGTAYEYAYDETYWTLATIKFYNTSFNGTSDLFAQTSYSFYKHWWAGSDINQIVFKIDPVNIKIIIKNFFFKFPKHFLIFFSRKLKEILLIWT